MANEVITIENLKEFKVKMLSAIYPVGSVYISFSNTSPASLFGGTWTQLSDRFLYASTGTAGSTGGEANHALTWDEMPQHSHATYAHITSAEANGYSLGKTGDFQDRVLVQATNGGQQTDLSGKSVAHNNMPPYVTCYMWRRTA